MEFVEDDRRDAPESRIKGHLPKEDPLRDKAQPRRLAHPGLEPDLVANHLPQRGSNLLGHPLGEEARRQPAGLEHHRLTTVTQEPMPEQHLRDLRRLARACRGLDDQPPLRPQRRHDGGLELVNGQVAGEGVRSRQIGSSTIPEKMDW